MNKEQLIQLIENLKLDKNEYWILSSSALVICGILETAGDLDIAVTEKGLNELLKYYDLKEKENGWYTANDKIEYVVDKKESWKIKTYNNYNLESIQKYYQYLKESTRKKDKKGIPLLEKYMEERKQIKMMFNIVKK